MKRDDVDYHLVRDQDLAVHERLNAWARWVRVRPHGWQVSPMFRLYRSKRQWDEPITRESVNVPEALEVERIVSSLPEKHRTAIRFAYVFCGSPVRMCRELGVSKQGLMDLIHTGRAMIRNTS